MTIRQGEIPGQDYSIGGWTVQYLRRWLQQHMNDVLPASISVPELNVDTLTLGTGVDLSPAALTSFSDAGIGGSSSKSLITLWEGMAIPSATGTGAIWRIPQVASANVTFNLTLMSVYFLTAGGSIGTISTEKSTDGVVWTNIATCSVAAAAHSATAVPSGITVTSGNYVRINWTTLPLNAAVWTVELEGTEQ